MRERVRVWVNETDARIEQAIETPHAYASRARCRSALLAAPRARPRCTWRRMEGTQSERQWRAEQVRAVGVDAAASERTLLTAADEQVLELEAELGGHVHEHQRHQRPEAPARRLRLLEREPNQQRRHRLRRAAHSFIKSAHPSHLALALALWPSTLHARCTMNTRAPGAARATRWPGATSWTPAECCSCPSGAASRAATARASQFTCSHSRSVHVSLQRTTVYSYVRALHVTDERRLLNTVRICV